MKLFSKTRVTLSTAVVLLTGTTTASADKLDDVIDAGVLRCGVVLDFPPLVIVMQTTSLLVLMLNIVKTLLQH